jgi:ribose transport system substrate-binding protein
MAKQVKAGPSRRLALRLTLGAAALAAFCAGTGAASAGSYTYNSASPDATKVDGADFAKSLGAVTAKPGIKIGVVLKTLNNQYWQGIASGVEAGAKAFGVEVTIQAATT